MTYPARKCSDACCALRVGERKCFGANSSRFDSTLASRNIRQSISASLMMSDAPGGVMARIMLSVYRVRPIAMPDTCPFLRENTAQEAATGAMAEENYAA
jgi:hypothetical protein